MAQYLNIRFVNDTASLTNATAITRRNPEILRNTDDYLCSVDRFSIDHGYFPVFDGSIAYGFRLLKKSDSSTTDQAIDLSAITDANGFGYSLVDFVQACNTALDTALTAVGQPTTDLAFSLNEDHTVTLTSTAGFRTDYELHLNQQLFSAMNFPHHSPALNTTWQYVKLALADSIKTHGSIRVSCVSRILLISNNIPIVAELTGSGSTVTNQTTEIITDFNIGGDLLYPVNDVYYTSQELKPHSMRKSTFKDADVAFYFTVHGSEQIYRVQLLTGGACSVKLRFDWDG